MEKSAVRQSFGSPIRGPHVSGRIIDVSQAAAYELGFADLTKVRVKILSIPEDQPAGEN
jgi:rare lipoprotein A (peptidoglycan hydrolase)